MKCQASVPEKVGIFRDINLVCSISSVEVSTAPELSRAVVKPFYPGDREWNELFFTIAWRDLHLKKKKVCGDVVQKSSSVAVYIMFPCFKDLVLEL